MSHPQTSSFHCLRYINVSEWTVTSRTFQRLLLQLPPHEQHDVQRFRFAKDQKLALGSRLLQRQLIHDLFQVKYDAIEIVRTPENKPYWKQLPDDRLACSYWNYNVSHHGTIVAIASSARTLVGVDVVRITDRPHEKTSVDEFFRAFVNHFHPSEWLYIRGAASVATDDGDMQYTRFYQLWSLKEAYIKAIGMGLGFPLLRAEFIRGDSGRWELLLDGQRASDWHFTCTQLDPMHLVSVAYGPYSAMMRSETSSLCFDADLDPFVTTAEEDAEVFEEGVRWQQWRLQDLLLEVS